MPYFSVWNFHIFQINVVRRPERTDIRFISYIPDTSTKKQVLVLVV